MFIKLDSTRNADDFYISCYSFSPINALSKFVLYSLPTKTKISHPSGYNFVLCHFSQFSLIVYMSYLWI